MRIRREPKKDAARKAPGHRSRYSLPDPPKAARIIVEQGAGKVVGYEMADGTVIKAGQPCCDDPTLCQRVECWSPWGVPTTSRWRWWR